MNYKLSLRVFSVLFIVIGMLSFVWGPSYLYLFGIKFVPEPQLVNGEVPDFWIMYALARMFGAGLLLYGVVIGFLAYVEGEKNRKLVAKGNAIGMFLLIALTVMQQIAFMGSLTGWIFTVLFAVVFVVFVMLTIKKETV